MFSAEPQSRKGQWLIIGAFLVISIISGLILSTQVINPDFFKRDIENFVFSNVENEFGNALNIIASTTPNSTIIENKLKEYLDFMENYGLSKSMTINGIIVAGHPVDDGLNITVANYYDASLEDLKIRVNGINSDLVNITNRDVKTFYFPDTAPEYVVNYTMKLNENGIIEPISNEFSFDRRVFGILYTRLKSQNYVRTGEITN